MNHDPHVVGPVAAHIVLPWTHRLFANLKTWALGVYHGLRRKYQKDPTSTSSSSASIAAAPDTPPSDPCSASAVAIKPATYKMLISTGSSVHKRLRLYGTTLLTKRRSNMLQVWEGNWRAVGCAGPT